MGIEPPERVSSCCCCGAGFSGGMYGDCIKRLRKLHSTSLLLLNLRIKKQSIIIC